MASWQVGLRTVGALVVAALLALRTVWAGELIQAMPPSTPLGEGPHLSRTAGDDPAPSADLLDSRLGRSNSLADSRATKQSEAGPAPVASLSLAALLRTTPLEAISEEDRTPVLFSAEPTDSLSATRFDPAGPAVEFWTWQVLPDGLLYRSYLAGGREPRFGSQWIHERDQDWLWDASLGGRVGLVRYGTLDPLWAQGWQIDIEGAAFPRLTLEENRDLVSADFRFGIPITMRQGRFETKLAFYHLSSHLGDEYKLTHPWIDRVNFSRDAFVLGLAFYPLRDVRTYVEAGWAFYCDGGTEPWEFQFGVDYSPLRPSGFAGAPFLAVNGRIREEVDFGGNFTFPTGWQWRGATGRLTRLGFHYFNGQSDQYQFYRLHEQQVGIGLWYDY